MRSGKQISKYFFLVAYLTFLIIIPLALFVLPANFFDSGQSMCLSLLIFDRECYACGMTRAIQHLIHFDFSQAYDFNKLSFIVLPILIYVNISQIFVICKKILKLKK